MASWPNLMYIILNCNMEDCVGQILVLSNTSAGIVTKLTRLGIPVPTSTKTG